MPSLGATQPKRPRSSCGTPWRLCFFASAKSMGSPLETKKATRTWGQWKGHSPRQCSLTSSMRLCVVSSSPSKNLPRRRVDSRPFGRRVEALQRSRKLSPGTGPGSRRSVASSRYRRTRPLQQSSRPWPTSWRPEEEPWWRQGSRSTKRGPLVPQARFLLTMPPPRNGLLRSRDHWGQQRQRPGGYGRRWSAWRDTEVESMPERSSRPRCCAWTRTSTTFTTSHLNSRAAARIQRGCWTEREKAGGSLIKRRRVAVSTSESLKSA
mmetsp:Transcript_932/g.3043  ORF Transcript_932/g.3043 Transcript_932/m.3043 type:complete len:265 (+) Transcript_932:2802-3596(+)